VISQTGKFIPLFDFAVYKKKLQKQVLESY